MEIKWLKENAFRIPKLKSLDITLFVTVYAFPLRASALESRIFQNFKCKKQTNKKKLQMLDRAFQMPNISKCLRAYTCEFSFLSFLGKQFFLW